MPLMLDHPPFKCVCVGMSGCGKTRWANDFIRQSKYTVYFIIDPEGQFAQRNKLRAAFTAQEILAQMRRGFVVFNPSEMFDDMGEAYEWFARYAYKMSEGLRGTKLFFVDEFQDIIRTSKITPYASKLLVSARNRGLDFLTCSLQYNMIHNHVRGQATQTVAFKTEDKLALAALVERGFNAQEIAALPRGSYVLRDTHNGIERRGKIF